MTTQSDPPKRNGFRLSQLIYDTRYRSITLQVIALLLIGGGLYWLYSNTVTNLAAQGKDFRLDFLWKRAGYDINQQLIPYTSNDTHIRAAAVGMFNTLLVAGLGCVFATILGIVFGVLRLSKNFMASRLAAVYVEGFRNVPLLLWIVAIFAIVTEATHQPRDFKTGDASMLFNESVAITNRGTFIPSPIFGAGWELLAIVAVLAIGAAIWLRKWSIKRQAATGESPMPIWLGIVLVIAAILLVYSLQAGLMFALLSIIKVAIIVAIAVIGYRVAKTFVPNVLAALIAAALIILWQYFIAGPFWGMFGFQPAFNPSVTFDYPELGGFNFSGGLQIRNSLIALLLALSLYTGAFIAEIVRAGILSVSKGQSEAAFALGLRANRTMSLVILPQAMRVIIPPLISQFLNLTKNSSLAIAIGYMDIRSTLGGITVNQTGRELEGILLTGMFYLILSLLISAGMNWFNNSVKLKER